MRYRIRQGIVTLGLLVAVAVPGHAAKAKPAAKPDAVVQIKLRDLLGVLPAKDQAAALAAIIQRLEEVLTRLKAIEARIETTPLPAVPEPMPDPLGKPR